MNKKELAQAIRKLKKDELTLFKAFVVIEKYEINKEYQFDKWFDTLKTNLRMNDRNIYDCLIRFIALDLITLQRFKYDDDVITELQYSIVQLKEYL